MKLNIKKGKENRAQRVVIYGQEGVGKSTFASFAPCPLYADTEEGSSHLDVDRVSVKSLDELIEVGTEIAKAAKAGTLEYKSLVVDTADHLWTMVSKQVCRENGWANLEAAGFGKGYAVAAEQFRDIFGRLDKLVALGVNVVIICHARVDKISPPDNSEYSKYAIKVTAPNKQAEVAREFIKEWSDCLLFMHCKISVNAETKKAIGKPKRTIYTETSVAWEAKNRVNLPSEMEPTQESMNLVFAGFEGVRQKAAAAKVDDGFNLVHDEPEPEPEQPQGELVVGHPKEEADLIARYLSSKNILKDGQSISDLTEAQLTKLEKGYDLTLNKANAWEGEQA